MTNAPDAFNSRQSSQFTAYHVGMLISWFVVLVAIAGLLLWSLGSGKVAEVGRLCFFCGLFFTCYLMTGKTVRLL